MSGKLSFKIGLLFFVIILIIELSLFFILYRSLVNDQAKEVMDSLLARGNSHRAVLEENFDFTTMEHVALMESASDFIVIVTNETGKEIISSDPVESEMRRVIDHTDFLEIPSQGEIIERRWQEEKFISTDSPITINSQHAGHVFMFADTEIIRDTVNQLGKQFLIIGLFTILLTVVAIFVLSRVITLPLIKMKKATEQLINGKNEVELHTERRDELGELARAISTLSTDLNRLKMQRNEFLASISHELRTPLTYVKGYAEIIERKETSEEERKEYIAIIREETEQLTLLVKDLFELAKMDQNQFIIKREHINLHELIQLVVSRISPAFAEKNIKLTIICSSDIYAFVDSERIQQVLINILDNAKKHSFRGGNVTLEVSQQEHHGTIQTVISDQGEGIPKEDLPYLFDRLYRVEKSRSRQSGGTGLGLAIAKEIIESHGGSIAIQSELRKGTKIIITLPGSEENEKSSFN